MAVAVILLMPVQTIIEGIFEVVGEILLEIVIRGPGYGAIKLVTFGRYKGDFGGGAVLIAGLVFWGLIGFAAYMIWLR